MEKMDGRRVRLIYCADIHTQLMPGECGTVSMIDDCGTWHVNWDKGSRLGLVPDIDRWEVLPRDVG